MPKRFAIRLPNYEQRLKILSLMLGSTSLSPDFSIEALARRTDGLSGSDLKETCRNAAMKPVREVMRTQGRSGMSGMEEAKKKVGVADRVEGVEHCTLTIYDSTGLRSSTLTSGRLCHYRLPRVYSSRDCSHVETESGRIGFRRTH